MLTPEDHERLSEANPSALLLDGFNDAYIGICNRYGQPSLAAYDYDKCIAVLMKRDGMTHEEAAEFFDFNVIGGWSGPGTPVFIERSHYEGERPIAGDDSPPDGVVDGGAGSSVP